MRFALLQKAAESGRDDPGAKTRMSVNVIWNLERIAGDDSNLGIRWDTSYYGGGARKA